MHLTRTTGPLAAIKPFVVLSVLMLSAGALAPSGLAQSAPPEGLLLTQPQLNLAPGPDFPELPDISVNTAPTPTPAGIVSQDADDADIPVGPLALIVMALTVAVLAICLAVLLSTRRHVSL